MRTIISLSPKIDQIGCLLMQSIFTARALFRPQISHDLAAKTADDTEDHRNIHRPARPTGQVTNTTKHNTDQKTQHNKTITTARTGGDMFNDDSKTANLRAAAQVAAQPTSFLVVQCVRKAD